MNLNHYINTDKLLTLLIVILICITPAYSQEQTVEVPDLTGLNVPQAAATLNLAGLRLGLQTAVVWTEGTPQPSGTISQQSVAPGDLTVIGSAIDINVLSEANIRLIYDDINFTLQNLTGAPLDLTRISFNSDDGTRRFLATRWRNSINEGNCTQIWSVARTQARPVDGCLRNGTIWLTTNNVNEHFWTQNAGVNQFIVVSDGLPQVTCPAAPLNSENTPTVCELVVNVAGTSTPATEYIYFAYTTDRLAIINTSDDSWMPLTSAPIYNFNPQATPPGSGFIPGNPALFGNADIVADVSRLAPGQCVLFFADAVDDANPPDECDVIALQTLSADQVFWLTPFERDSPFENTTRSTCPPATEGRLTICVIPR